MSLIAMVNGAASVDADASIIASAVQQCTEWSRPESKMVYSIHGLRNAFFYGGVEGTTGRTADIGGTCVRIASAVALHTLDESISTTETEP